MGIPLEGEGDAPGNREHPKTVGDSNSREPPGANAKPGAEVVDPLPFLLRASGTPTKSRERRAGGATLAGGRRHSPPVGNELPPKPAGEETATRTNRPRTPTRRRCGAPRKPALARGPPTVPPPRRPGNRRRRGTPADSRRRARTEPARRLCLKGARSPPARAQADGGRSGPGAATSGQRGESAWAISRRDRRQPEVVDAVGQALPPRFRKGRTPVGHHPEGEPPVGSLTPGRATVRIHGCGQPANPLRGSEAVPVRSCRSPGRARVRAAAPRAQSGPFGAAPSAGPRSRRDRR